MISIRPLSVELTTKAETELNERSEHIANDLEAIRQWLAKTSHITSRTDDQFLMIFLRGCKHSLERVKEKLDMFYTVRTNLPEFIKNRDIREPVTAKMLKAGFSIPLEATQHPDSAAILIIRPGCYDASEHTITEAMKLAVMMNEVLMLENDNVVIAGQIIIFDLANVTFNHMLQMTPTVIKKLTNLWQEGSPLRQKGFHFINLPAVAPQSFFNLLTSFLSEKLRQRVHFHTNYTQTLFEHVPQHLLPADYGGNSGKVDELMVKWESKLESYQKYFEDEANFGVDESKRLRDVSQELGTKGTFRQLEVD